MLQLFSINVLLHKLKYSSDNGIQKYKISIFWIGRKDHYLE